ncbi:hypothetical protein AB0J52_18835, partial [Spirillospora sp. NPDC049652]
MSSVRRRAWGSIIPALTVLAGALFAASASTARGTDLRDTGRTRITELITAEQRRTLGERARYDRLRREVDGLSRAAGRADARVNQAQADADRLAVRAGMTPVAGAGVRVAVRSAGRGGRVRAGEAGR